MKNISFLSLFLLAILSYSCQSNPNKSVPEGMPPGGPPPGFPEGMPPPPPFNMEPHEKAGIYIKGGTRMPENEYTDEEVVLEIAEGAPGITANGAEGVLISSSKFEATGIVISEGDYTLGGKKDYFTLIPEIEKDYIGTKIASEFTPDSDFNFNSVLLFSMDSPVNKDVKTGSSGIDAGADGAVLFIENVYMQVDGAQRYVSSTFGDATTVINDAFLVSTGNANGLTDEVPLPFSNEALSISGSARTNFTIGSSHTYYNNSTVIAEGWAALSTDASSGDGLDLYAYNSKAYALNGGYGTYADFTCRVHLYGSYMEAAEVGGIIAKSGQIMIMDGTSAPKEVLEYNKGAITREGSHVKAGRNALMIHAPDMMGEGLKAVDHGTLDVSKSTLETSLELTSSFDYETHGKATAAYVDYVKGDIILIKSTSATVMLEETNLISSNGVLFHTVLNSDRMGNFLKAQDNKAKGEDGSPIVKPIRLGLKQMDVTGDILHDDFHRNMLVNLQATKIKGKINQGSHASWTKLWADMGIEEANWLQDDSWEGTNELSLSLDATSSWIVTATSNMTQLSIAEGASIVAPDGYALLFTIDGEKAIIKPGDYQGSIMLTISKR